MTETRAALHSTFLSLFILGAAAGCGAPSGQFLIVQNQVPEGGCVIPSTLGAVYRGTGDLDVRLVQDGAKRGYAVFPLLQNNLPAPSAGQVGDPNRIALSGFDVDISLPSDAPQEGPIWELFQSLELNEPGLLHYGVPTSGSVASGGGNTASSVDGLPAELARRIRATGVLEAKTFIYVNTTIRARGDTNTGGVTSDPFKYPIRVCDGCLIAQVDVCPFTSSPTNLGNECNVAQDQSVDCCVAGSGLVCPPTVAPK